MIILKVFGKMIYLMFMAAIYIMFFPLWIIGKLFFWWLPTDDYDSYEKNDEEWLFWKEHGHEW